MDTVRDLLKKYIFVYRVVLYISNIEFLMRQKLIFLSCFLVFTLPGSAQLWKMKKMEVSAGTGISQFFGDVGGFSQGENLLGVKDFILRQTRFNINGSARYRILNNFSVRANLATGIFHCSDAKGSNMGRNFEASTLFFEPSALAEYYILRNRVERTYHFMKGIGYRRPMKRLQLIDLYLFSGIGNIYYKVNPSDKLKSYMTGSGGSTMVIPGGIGVAVNTGDYYFSAELGGRYTFSDNIDGYTSKYSKSNDIYYLFNINLNYKIKTNSRGIPEFLASARKHRRR